jgi:hypothetical protein
MVVVFTCCCVISLVISLAYLLPQGETYDPPLPTNVTHCGPPLLDLDHFEVRVCAIENDVYTRVCTTTTLMMQCLLIEDFDFNVFCKRLPDEWAKERARIDSNHGQ